MTRRLTVILVLLIAATFAGGVWWVFNRPAPPSDTLTLYGNVDLRYVSLAFNQPERIAEVLVQEGDRVHKGERLATQETKRLKPALDDAEAEQAAQQKLVERDHKGSRPQEIDQARAALAAAEAEAVYAQQQYDRLQGIGIESHNRAVSRQDLDSARSALDVAKARVDQAQKTLDLALLGPREEDVARDEAMLRAMAARTALARQHLADTVLLAPVDGIIRTRLLEVGDMASPDMPVYSLAITDPKWIRTYVSERDLPRIHEGMKAQITTDGLPGRSLDGWVGFISPQAEFTPKNVETPDLRTSLVYEVRIFVHDDANLLRLGMPATVRIDGAATPAPAS